MVRTRHSDETDDFKNGDFISIEERTKRLQKKDKAHVGFNQQNLNFLAIHCFKIVLFWWVGIRLCEQF